MRKALTWSGGVYDEKVHLVALVKHNSPLVTATKAEAL